MATEVIQMALILVLAAVLHAETNRVSALEQLALEFCQSAAPGQTTECIKIIKETE